MPPVAAASAAPARQWVIDFVLLAAIWGASFLFTRMATVEFGPVPTAGLRVSVAAASLLPMLFLRGLAPILRRHWRAIFVVGLLNSAIPFTCFAFALLAITTGLSSILNATVPLFGAVVAWWWLKDLPVSSRILGLVIGFTGVALLAWDKASFKPDASGIAPAWAVLACLLATTCYAIAASATKRYLGGLPALVTAAGSQVAAAITLALPTVWYWPQQLPSVHAWIGVLMVGVACTGIAYVLYFRIIEQAGPARALAVTFVVPVFAVIYGALFLGESVSGWMLLCGGVIVCGTALSTGLLAWCGRASP
jgi:drug/metabolite transporter (DMT)-like permease